MEVLILCLLAIAYLLYQYRRITQVYNIRTKWVDDEDPRWYQYTYKEMLKPSSKNWFGIKPLKESDF